MRSAQGRGQLTTNKNRKRLAQVTRALNNKLLALAMPEIIIPRFALNTQLSSKTKPVPTIKDGSCSYERDLLYNINFQIRPGEKVALCGPNACGKTTLAKAILGHSPTEYNLRRSGLWLTPSSAHIGYVDQHYKNLNPEKSPWQHIHEIASSWSIEKIRMHLNNFLFRKNEEITTKARFLSGGEKARLSLAIIAASTPSLLILDEATNNLDLNTREHVIQVLKDYPGALLVISHDEDFLTSLSAYNILLSCFQAR